MAQSITHNELLLRPPPGTRFTIYGSDCILEFQREKGHEVKEWLLQWILNFDPEFIDPRIRNIIALQQQQQQMAVAPPQPLQPPIETVSNPSPPTNVIRIPLPTPIKQSVFPEKPIEEPEIIVCGAILNGQQCVLQAGHPESQQHQAPSRVPGQWVRW